MKKNIYILPLILLSLAIYQGGIAQQHPKPRILGIVMGISKYQNVPSLKYADKDALSFYNFLLSPAGGGADTNNIRLLLNEKATSYNFFEAMDNLLDMAKEGDQVYIYFAGHGDIEKKTERQNGFLIGYNAPANCYAAGGCISVRFLQDYVETLVSKNKSKVTLIIDACRSGKLAGGSQGAEITALALQAEWKGVTKILSCQPGETSLESEKWGSGGGVFTYFMLKGLLGQADENGDGKISAMELGNYLDKNVMRETQEKQLPVIVGDRRQEITRVDKEHALALLNQMERPITLPPEKQSAGFEADISSINDISILKEYEKFKEYIKTENLIAYNDADSSKETALSIYLSLENKVKVLPIVNKMKGELLAALQNKAQVSMNQWLNNIYTTDSATIVATYRELNSALSILDSSEMQYGDIKFKSLLWSSFLEIGTDREVILDKCLAINPNDPMANICKGIILDNKNKYEESLIYFDKVTEIAKNWMWGWNNKAIALSSLGKYNEGIQFIDKALEIKPDFEVAWSNKSITLDNMRKWEEALICANKALEIKPDLILALISKGGILNHLGHKEEAYKWLSKANSLHPKGQVELFNLTNNMLENGRNDEALKCINNALTIYPKNDNFWVLKARILSSNGKIQEAINCNERAIELNPKSYDAYNSFGYISITTGKNNEGLKYSEKAIEINPNNHIAYLNKAWALGNLRRNEEALLSINKSISIDSNDAIAFNIKGVLLGILGKYEEQMICYDKSIEINPNYYMPWHNKGILLVDLKRYDEALKCYDNAIKLNPSNYDSWMSKAYVFNVLNQIDEAKKCLNEIKNIVPQNINGFRALAGAYLAIKNYEEANNYYDKILSINSELSDVLYNKACIMSIMKNKNELLKFLTKAVQLDKKFKEAAAKDPDFKDYWNDPDFLELVK